MPQRALILFRFENFEKCFLCFLLNLFVQNVVVRQKNDLKIIYLYYKIATYWKIIRNNSKQLLFVKRGWCWF